MLKWVEGSYITIHTADWKNDIDWKIYSFIPFFNALYMKCRNIKNIVLVVHL